LLARPVFIAISAAIFCAQPLQYSSAYLNLGPFESLFCTSRPSSDPTEDAKTCCIPARICDESGTCSNVKQCHDCIKLADGRDNCLCISNCGDENKQQISKDKVDTEGLVNELPEPPTKGTPDVNINKNSGILIDRDTTGNNNTTNTTTSLTKNKNTIVPDILK
jgi:hypothetical protein